VINCPLKRRGGHDDVFINNTDDLQLFFLDDTSLLCECIVRFIDNLYKNRNKNAPRTICIFKQLNLSAKVLAFNPSYDIEPRQKSIIIKLHFRFNEYVI